MHYLAFNPECIRHHRNICGHKQLQTPPSYLDSRTHCIFLNVSPFCWKELDSQCKKKNALNTKGTEFSWTLAARWILCLLLTPPHNKPLVDVWKMFMYLKTKVIRASGYHSSSCVFSQTQTYPLFFFLNLSLKLSACGTHTFILNQGLILSARSFKTGGGDRDSVSIWQRCVIWRQGQGVPASFSSGLLCCFFMSLSQCVTADIGQVVFSF